ncbi:hypothetical protein D3C86_2143250 [compost metagenome]
MLLDGVDRIGIPECRGNVLADQVHLAVDLDGAHGKVEFLVEKRGDVAHFAPPFR